MDPIRLNTLSVLAFVFLAGAATVPDGSAQLTTTAVVGNVVPTIEDIALPSSVNPTAGGNTTVPVTVTVSDLNGFQDLVAVTVTVYKPDGTTVHVAAGNAVANEDGSGVAQTFSYAFDMRFYDAPAVGNDTYKVHAVASDAKGAASLPSTAGFSYTELVAMSLDADSLSFGALDPGQRSDVAAVTVTNRGNTLIDLDTSGTGLSDGDGHEIAVDRVKYDLAHANLTAERALSSDPYTNTGFDLAFGPAVSRATFWQLDVPSGEEQYLPAGTYSGSVTLSAIQG